MSKTALRIWSISVALALTAVPVRTQGPATILTGLTVGQALSKLDETLNKAIENAGKEARQTVMVAGQQARLLLETFKQNNLDVLNVAADKLDVQRRHAFEDIRVLVAEFSLNLNATADKMEDISKRIEVAIANFPLTPDTPRLLKYKPVFYAGLNVGDQVTVLIDGSFLARGTPTLVLDAKEYKSQVQTDTNLTFLVPASVFRTNSTTVMYKSFKLTVYGERTSYVFWKQPYPVNCWLLIYALPERIGTYKVEVVKRGTARRTQAKSTPTIETYSASCDGRRDCHQVNAEPDWLIDTQSIGWAQEHNDGGRFEGWRNLSAAGFCADLSAEPHGHLKTPFGCVQGTIGHISGKVKYTEYKDVEADSREAFALTGNRLVWGKDASHTMPDGTRGIIVTLKLFDGREVVYDGPTTGDVVGVEYNTQTRTLILKPKNPDSVLRR